MDAHAADLRAEVADDGLVAAVRTDYRTAAIDAATRALLDFAVKLTRSPGEMSEADVRALRDAGWDDRAIHGATQVIAYFNYINRVADALGTDPEPEMTWRR